MIKALVLLTLIAFTVTKDFEVLVFRGEIALMTATINFEDVTSQGILLTEVQLSEASTDSANAWKDVVYEKTTNKVILPLRRTSIWKLISTDHLGAILQSSYTTDIGDNFQLTLAFGFCSNDFEIEEFKNYLNQIEALRKSNSALLAQLFSTVKKEASSYISGTMNLNDITNKSIKNEDQVKKLEAELKDLQTQYDALVETILEKSNEEFISETNASDSCAKSQISKSEMSSIDNRISINQDYVLTLQDSLKDANLLTDSENDSYASVHNSLSELLTNLGKYNLKMPAPVVKQGENFDFDNIRPLYPTN